MLLKNVFVGWRSVSGRPDLLAKPKAPANYKDPQKIQEFIDNAMADRDRRAERTPGALAFSLIEAVDADARQVFYADDAKAPFKFLSFLRDRVAGFSGGKPGTGADGRYIRPADESYNAPVCPAVVAFHARTFVTALVCEYLACHAKVSGELGGDWATWLWPHIYPAITFDPLQLLVDEDSYSLQQASPMPQVVKLSLPMASLVQLICPEFSPSDSDAAKVLAVCQKMGFAVAHQVAVRKA